MIQFVYVVFLADGRYCYGNVKANDVDNAAKGLLAFFESTQTEISRLDIEPISHPAFGITEPKALPERT